MEAVVSVHAMRELFKNVESEVVLLVDTSNAFNFFNRTSTPLNNIMFEVCPSFATILTNVYCTYVISFVY